MAYTTNPDLPRTRAEAVRLVRHGWSKRRVARHIGVEHSTIIRWCRKAEQINGRMRTIPTESSRPHFHPQELNSTVIKAIIKQQSKHGAYSGLIYRELKSQRIKVSLSSVKRTLHRHGLTNKRSSWKKRPEVAQPRDFVERVIHKLRRVIRMK